MLIILVVCCFCASWRIAYTCLAVLFRHRAGKVVSK